MKRSTLFILTLIFWLLLVWPIDPLSGKIRMADISVGLVVAVLVALIMHEKGGHDLACSHSPIRYFWALIYIPVLAYYILKANLDVAYRVLHPAMPIHPGIVKLKTKLQSSLARTVLANSITLTPGTLTLDFMDDGTYYVHWINVKTQKMEDATKQIAGRFEWFVQRIFE